MKKQLMLWLQDVLYSKAEFLHKWNTAQDTLGQFSSSHKNLHPHFSSYNFFSFAFVLNDLYWHNSTVLHEYLNTVCCDCTIFYHTFRIIWVSVFEVMLVLNNSVKRGSSVLYVPLCYVRTATKQDCKC